MFAERADEVIRKYISFIDISADLADKAFLSFCVRFRLYVVLIICVSHCLFIIHYAGLCHGTDKHAVCVQVNILLNLKRDGSIDVFRQDDQAVVRAYRRDALKFVHCTSALESESLEYAERRVYRQTVHVKNTGLLDNVVRVVGFVDIHSYTVRRVGKLCYRVDNQTVVLLSVVGCNHIQTVSDTEKSGKIILVGSFRRLGDILLAELVSHCLKLIFVFRADSRFDLYSCVQPGDVFGLFKHALHNLSGKRSPGTVFDQTDGALLIVAFCQVIDKLFHEREDFRVICCGGKNQFAVAESISNCL